jgi:hypothetical protein
VTFRGLSAGRYLATALAPKAIGSIRFVTVGKRSASVRLSITVPQRDTSRRASAVFTPGAPLTLEARDAAGVSYSLWMPPNALTMSATITLTPYAKPLVIGKPNGLGVEISPSGLELVSSGLLTVTGGRSDKNETLLTYDPKHGFWLPRLTHKNGGAGRTYLITHFSSDAESDPGAAAADQAAAQMSETFHLSSSERVDLGDAIDAVSWFNWLAQHGNEPGPGDPLYDRLLQARVTLKALATRFAASACSEGPEEQGWEATQIFAGLAQIAGAITEDEFTSLVAQASLRCAQAYRTVGNQFCRAGEQAQAPVQREQGRGYLKFAGMLAGIAHANDLIFQLFEDKAACTGYHVQAAVSPRGVSAITCGDLVAGHWVGTWTGTLITGEGGTEHHFEVDIPADGSTVPFLPHIHLDTGNGGTADQDLTVAAAPAGRFPAALDFQDVRVYAGGGYSNTITGDVPAQVIAGTEQGQCPIISTGPL